VAKASESVRRLIVDMYAGDFRNGILRTV
jgi:hypothetical protein